MFQYLEHRAVYVRIIQESKTVFLAREVMERMNGLMRKFARKRTFTTAANDMEASMMMMGDGKANAAARVFVHRPVLYFCFSRK
jgi:hypothetical protein